MQNNLYTMQPGELILFSPYVLHRSYGDQNVPFQRLVLYSRAMRSIRPNSDKHWTLATACTTQIRKTVRTYIV